jgi:outer membrane biosynthesis protein TonB
MDRADAAGFGVAAAGHVALFALLSAGFASTRVPMPKGDPIEVSFVDEVGLESRSPTPSAVEPAPLAGPQDAPPEPAMPAPPQLQEVPVPQPQPRLQAQPRTAAPSPRPAPKAQPRPAPAKAAAVPATKAPPRRNAAGLNSVVAGLSERETPNRSAEAPAAAAGPAVEASLVAEVRRQLKPHWQRAVPTGADAEALRTELSLTLGRDGRVTGMDVVRTTGITPSNRPQVALHQERARRAVTLASPFNLPDKYYDAWRQLNVTLDLRLSQ